ncbi:NlpC/P60 family protein [Streptomyces hoynatensis]|uniref:NlpC/P60 family protein n=1 Tax=Streptomyces hoynatensis TaxID=1141874 RepID=A0A3A9ZEC7_9ACTN|nr:C40 family peptidase [Streptomyces hoynatensis]RKN46832.1 NlpC/P60 family protein [Streptomyces hoynatensis]
MSQQRKSLWHRHRGAHRKRSRPSPITGPVLRTAAATLSLASLPFGADAALAEPAPAAADFAEVRDRVDALHHEAEEATERYNAATEAAAGAEARLERLQDLAARRTEELNAARDSLGARARAEYRLAGLPPSVQLALSSSPDDFLERAAVLDRAGDREAGTVREVRRQLRDLDQLRAEAGEQADALAGAREEAREERERVTERLAEAEQLLGTLTSAQRARVLGTAGAPAAARPEAPVAAPGPRAAAAVAFAYAQLGKPYGWGATGPDAYDCSGLTQAAWSSAGVALPRTSYRQVGAGTRVSRAELAPGDLVFYYSGYSHVALYVGGGQIIHASRPGAPVRVAPVDSMPFAAATRPAS